MPGGEWALEKLEGLSEEELKDLREETDWCPLSAATMCEAPFALYNSIQDARRHRLHPDHAAGLVAARANGTCKVPGMTKYNKEELAEGELQGAAAARKNWRPGESMGFVGKLNARDPAMAHALTVASMRHLKRRKTNGQERVELYHATLALALEGSVQEALIKAAGI